MKLFALGLIGATALTFTACSDDDDPDNPNRPILTVTESTIGIDGGLIEATVGTVLEFEWEARKGDVDLDLFEIAVDDVSISETTDGGNTLPYEIANADDEIYTDGISLNVGNSVGAKIYTFKVTDRDGLDDEVIVTVNVMAATTPLATEVNGAFFHIGGSLEGAYDLVNEGVVPASDPDANKDMENTDMAGSTFTGSWEAANTTMFVKAPTSFDYDNATVESATATYTAGTPAAAVSNPAANDIYVANLRGTNDYAVIKITNVDPNDNTCNCANTGKISFDFKKE